MTDEPFDPNKLWDAPEPVRTPGPWDDEQFRRYIEQPCHRAGCGHIRDEHRTSTGARAAVRLGPEDRAPDLPPIHVPLACRTCDCPDFIEP